MSDLLIQTVNVAKSYCMGGVVVRVLRGITLSINRGELVSVMGPSGSGKSTLMNLLGLLDRPDQGNYLLDGQDMSQLDTDRRADIRNRRIGFVFQAFNLLARNTALENVELPLIYSGVPKLERRRKAEAALATVGLGHRKDHWPHGLSGGEQQRVAIARAIVNDPDIIVADEPTGSLDSRTGLEIMALLQLLNRAGRTIILVTHDAYIARHASRIVSVQDGFIIDDRRIQGSLDAAAQLTGNSPTEADSETHVDAGEKISCSLDVIHNGKMLNI